MRLGVWVTSRVPIRQCGPKVPIWLGTLVLRLNYYYRLAQTQLVPMIVLLMLLALTQWLLQSLLPPVTLLRMAGYRVPTLHRLGWVRTNALLSTAMTRVADA